MAIFKALILLITLSSFSFAADEDIGSSIADGLKKVKDKSLEIKDNISRELALNSGRREKKEWGVHFNYAYIDTWISGKKGINAYYVESSAVTWDFEYLKGSLSLPSFIFELGEFTDKRFSLLKRSFGDNNSFHYLYGVYYNHLNIHLGDDLLESVSGDERHSVDVMDIKVMGASWGIGNRWQTSGKFTWGIDWFTINMPLVRLGASTPYLDETNDKKDRENAKDAIETLQSYPTFSILKVQLGISW